MLDDIVKEFLVESYENLDQLDRDLMALEETPDDRNRLSSIFRTIHTIKGTSGFLAFPKLEHVTHVGENLLVRLRDGELRLNAEITTGLLAMVDAVRAILGNIEAQANEGEEAYESLISNLEELRQGRSLKASISHTKDAAVNAEIAVEEVVKELQETVSEAVGRDSSKKSKKTRAKKSTAPAPAPAPIPTEAGRVESASASAAVKVKSIVVDDAEIEAKNRLRAETVENLPASKTHRGGDHDQQETQAKEIAIHP